MKHPLWILNSTLLILAIFIVGFVLFTRQKPRARTNIEPSATLKPLKGESVTINISKIYENDLFGTYQKDQTPYTISQVLPIPEAPAAKPVTVPPIPKPQFMDPLNISLKGIIIMLNNDAFNRAIILDNKTGKETSYRVGQTIEDAQLIQILSNKVIFLRSNGQQEVLYLREKDAQVDPTYVAIDNWNDIIQKTSENHFAINPQEFVLRVKNLGMFIDMLDLITVYKDGHSVGCRVGTISDKSLGRELGLQTGDIVLSINNIPATDTTQRFAIYKAVTAMRPDDIIELKLLRKQQEMTLFYMLKDFVKKPVSATGADTTASTPMSADDIKNEQIKILQQHHKFAPTLDKIREQERLNMMQKGAVPENKPATKNEPTKAE